MTAPASDIVVNPTSPATGALPLSEARVADKPAITDLAPKVSAKTDPVLHTYKRAPGEIVRGQGVYLYDAEGKRYLDFVSGIAVNALGYGDAGPNRTQIDERDELDPDVLENLDLAGSRFDSIQRRLRVNG